MARYNVHFGIRLTYDVEVEADSPDEAEAKARPEYEAADLHDFDFADDDVDIWEVK